MIYRRFNVFMNSRKRKICIPVLSSSTSIVMVKIVDIVGWKTSVLRYRESLVVIIRSEIYETGRT